jgi:hypothetical protein
MRNFKIIITTIFVFISVFNANGQSEGYEKVNAVMPNDILKFIFNNRVHDLRKFCLLNQGIEIKTEEVEYVENQYIIYLDHDRWHIKAMIVKNFLDDTPETVWKFYITWAKEKDKVQFLQYFPALANFTFSEGVYYRSMQTLKEIGDNTIEFWLYYPPLELKPKK